MDRPWLAFDTLGLLAVNAGADDHVLIAAARGVSGVCAAAVCLLVLAAACRPASRAMAMRALFGMGLAWCLVHGIQQLLPLPRPAALGLGQQWIGQGPRPGFPSMHVAVAAALAAELLLQRSRWAWPAAVFALAMAWSRVCLGVHFPLDVLAGAATGLMAVVAAAAISRVSTVPHRFWLARRVRRPAA